MKNEIYQYSKSFIAELFIGNSAGMRRFLGRRTAIGGFSRKYLLNESQLEAYVNKYYADYDNWKSDSDDKGDDPELLGFRKWFYL